MNEKTLSTHQFLKKFSKEQANAILTLKDEQSVTVGKLKLEREKEKPDAILIELYEETLKITIAIILRARLSFEQEKSTKEKLILEAKLKALQEINKQKSTEPVKNFEINPPSEIINELNSDNWAIFLKECIEYVDISEYKVFSTRIFNALIRRIEGELEDFPKLTKFEKFNLILEYLHNLNSLQNKKELQEIRSIGEISAKHLQKSLELFFQRINYVPKSKE